MTGGRGKSTVTEAQAQSEKRTPEGSQVRVLLAPSGHEHATRVPGLHAPGNPTNDDSWEDENSGASSETSGNGSARAAEAAERSAIVASRVPKSLAIG